MGQAARKLKLVPPASMPVLREVVAFPRKAPRACVYVSVHASSQHNFWSGLTMNVAEGGIFLATHNAPPIGTLIALHVTVASAREPIYVLTEVAWTRDDSGDDDVPAGLGLKFVDLPASAHMTFRNFTATVREPLYFDT